MNIVFDTANNPEEPIFVLATKSGNKLGQLKAEHIVISDALEEASEFSFKVTKYKDGVADELWDEIKNFRLAWCKNYDMWYQITVELDEESETVKTVYGVQLGQAELSQIMLYDNEYNTEDDIARDDYTEPSVLWNELNTDASILHRMMEKAPHYSIIHVDSTIQDIQRSFSFDDVSLCDAFQEVAEEIGCLFVFNSDSDSDGNVQRTISVYDIQSNCYDCGYRGEYTGTCPNCGSTNIDEGYGEDTTIFVTSDELGESITYTTDTDSVKNCFKLEAGDDLMTATIRNCNPNGTDYIWYITDDMKEDMSDELVAKIDSYDELYSYYQNSYSAEIDSTILESYNAIAVKYQAYDSDIEEISSPIVGYPALMTAYYNTIDLALYLESGLLPDASLDDTDASEQAALLTAANLSPVAVSDLDSLSTSTANSAVLAMAKVVVDSRYQVKVSSSSLEDAVWTGNFTVTNYSDEDDTATSSTIRIAIDDDYETYVYQKIQKSLNDDDVDDLSITALFDKDEDEFAAELKKYCLTSLTSFYDACQSCLDILVEQGVADESTWSSYYSDDNDASYDLYTNLYVPYYTKLGLIEDEMAVRQNEIYVIEGSYDTDGNLLTSGLQTYISDIQSTIQSILDFENYLGETLFLEFCIYRREDKYTNENYISDGLDNAELFSNALEFITVASNEIYKSAELQHSISTQLKNLLVIPKFKSLVDYFKIGNWIRVMIDSEVYRLRLISFEIDFDNLETISVEFSDVTNTINGMSDQSNLMSTVSSMATSYGSVSRQASQGSKSNSILSNWVEKGLDVTNAKIMSGADNQTQVWDEHGMLFKQYNSITDDYSDTQLKIINSTMCITDDNWKTVKTAIGGYYYYNPVTAKLTYAYGVNAETLVGKLILGEQLGIYNNYGTMTFDADGLTVSNDTNTFSLNPNSDTLLDITHDDESVFWLDKKGNANFSGDVSASTITGSVITGSTGSFTNDFSVGETQDEWEPSFKFDSNKQMISMTTGISEVESDDEDDEEDSTDKQYSLITMTQQRIDIDQSDEEIYINGKHISEYFTADNVINIVPIYTYTNTSDITVSSDETSIITQTITAESLCTPIMIATIPFTMDVDGVVTFQYYLDSTLMDNCTVSQYCHAGDNVITLSNNFTFKADTNYYVKVTMMTSYIESEIRSQDARIAAIEDYIDSGTYSDPVIDETVPTASIEQTAIKSSVFAPGLASTDVWDGTIKASDTISMSDIVVGVPSGITTIPTLSEEVSVDIDNPTVGAFTQTISMSDIVVGVPGGITILPTLSEEVSVGMTVTNYEMTTSKAISYDYDSTYVTTDNGAYALITSFSASSETAEIDEGSMAKLHVDLSVFNEVESMVISG